MFDHTVIGEFLYQIIIAIFNCDTYCLFQWLYEQDLDEMKSTRPSLVGLFSRTALAHV